MGGDPTVRSPPLSGRTSCQVTESCPSSLPSPQHSLSVACSLTHPVPHRRPTRARLSTWQRRRTRNSRGTSSAGSTGARRSRQARRRRRLGRPPPRPPLLRLRLARLCPSVLRLRLARLRPRAPLFRLRLRLRRGRLRPRRVGPPARPPLPLSRPRRCQRRPHRAAS